MRKRSKLLLAGLGATIALAALISTASANRIATSSQGFRATWTELEFIGFEGGTPVRCPVTIEGSFHSRTISKVLEALVGYVSRVVVAESACTGGTGKALTETLPWHIRYAGFGGTLPTITRINLNLVNSAFLVQQLGLFNILNACLYQSNATSPMKGILEIGAGGVVNNLRVDETAGIPLVRTLSGVCPNPGKLHGTATVTVQGGTTRITVTLVA